MAGVLLPTECSPAQPPGTLGLDAPVHSRGHMPSAQGARAVPSQGVPRPTAPGLSHR